MTQILKSLFLTFCVLTAALLTGCGRSIPEGSVIPAGIEFVPVVSGGSSQIAAPEKVSFDEKQRIVSAETYQDGINAAVQIAQEKKPDASSEQASEQASEQTAGAAPDSNAPDLTRLGVYLIQTKSGMGIVSAGQSVYRASPSGDETRLAQRRASVIAFEKAKAGLAQHLHGLGIDAQTKIVEAMGTSTNEQGESRTDHSTSMSESIAEAVDGVIRGFVIYSVDDQPLNDTKGNLTGGVMTVSIVTTPKTRRALDQMAPNVVEADSFSAGIKQAITELKSGVVPLHGSKQIILRETGEIGFVGFGSAVIKSSNDPAVRAKNKIDAAKIAQMRAKSAFIGTLKGERIQSIVRTGETSSESETELDELLASERYAKGQNSAEEALHKFDSKMELHEEYKSARAGLIPPGLLSEQWTDKAEHWSYCAVIYTPTVQNFQLEP